MQQSGAKIPTQADWKKLKTSVMAHGIYNQNLQAVPPTGSIPYINNSQAQSTQLHLALRFAKKVSWAGFTIQRHSYRKTPGTTTKMPMTSVQIKTIETYAVATQHVDQGLSLTLSSKTPHHKRRKPCADKRLAQGHKTIYYIRIRQQALLGTEVDSCVSCML